jgi:hypothetical protein
MRGRLRKYSTIALAVASVVVLGACGDSHTKVTTGTYAGESGKNAPYLNVGALTYQVQLSRELNPANNEDAAYLEGLSPAERKLAPGEEWFAVFVQVYNTGESPAQAVPTMTISDTQGNTYTPLLTEPTNLYAYRGGAVASKGEIPEPGSPAASGPTQGALLLYKIQTVSLDNRPLVIKIVDPQNPSEKAFAELDV